jgi:hypothetical protein
LHTAAVLPFSIINPSEISVSGIVLAGADNAELSKVESAVSHEAFEAIPTVYALEQNYPNPFNPSTDIRYAMPQSGNVQLVIYNMLGQEVRTLVSGQMEQGTHLVRWDGKDNSGRTLSSGVYLYRMQAGSFIASHKMLLLK